METNLTIEVGSSPRKPSILAAPYPSSITSKLLDDGTVQSHVALALDSPHNKVLLSNDSLGTVISSNPANSKISTTSVKSEPEDFASPSNFKRINVVEHTESALDTERNASVITDKRQTVAKKLDSVMSNLTAMGPPKLALTAFPGKGPEQPSASHLANTYSSTAPPKADVWTRLQHLQSLQSLGVVGGDEYTERKQQLVDELTGTTLKNKDAHNRAKGSVVAFKRVTEDPPAKKREKGVEYIQHGFAKAVVPRPPPKDWSTVKAERAIKHSFNLDTGEWSQGEVMVQLEQEPFAKGSCRLAYHMVVLSLVPYSPANSIPSQAGSHSLAAPLGDSVVSVGSDSALTAEEPKKSEQTVSATPEDKRPSSDNEAVRSKPEDSETVSYVAKISIDPYEDRDSYFQDVAMQMYTREYARKYNSYKVPKKVDFVKAWILELVERPHRPLCAVERFITGPYRKHNNNFGYVSEDERNTPQAFSHFTYEASQHRILICDIQGVGDLYTDPQIHSVDGRGFGKGNMGDRGFKKFLSSHRCNPICRYLKLPPVNANYDASAGTVPNEPYMPKDQVDAVDIELKRNRTPVLMGLPKKTNTESKTMGLGKKIATLPPRQPIPAQPPSTHHDEFKWCFCTVL